MLDIHQNPREYEGTSGGVSSPIGATAHVPKPYYLCLKEGKRFVRMHLAPLMLTDLETHPIHKELAPSEIHLISEKGSCE